MDTFNTDDQLQILKQWLRDNGLALFAGVLLGGVLVAGWTGWSWYSERQARLASTEFEHLSKSLRAGDHKHADEIVTRLTGQYARTPYAALAALAVAGDQVRRSQFDAALKNYQWVTQSARDRKLRRVAALRRARLLWSLGRSEEALAELQTRKAGSFAPLFAELRGDILAGQGRPAEARQAYAEAMAGEIPPDQRAAIELKLNDLGAQPLPASPEGG